MTLLAGAAVAWLTTILNHRYEGIRQAHDERAAAIERVRRVYQYAIDFFVVVQLRATTDPKEIEKRATKVYSRLMMCASQDVLALFKELMKIHPLHQPAHYDSIVTNLILKMRQEIDPTFKDDVPAGK
jgi:hypothetical protein